MKSRLVSIVAVLLVPVVVILALGNVLLAHAQVQTSPTACAVTWNEVTVPKVGSLQAVAAISTNDVWAAGDGDLIHWNGATWTTVPNPIGEPIARLVGLPNGDVWASNADTVMHWDGTQWSQVGDNVGFGTGSDLAVLASDDIWVTTSNGVQHWDGSQWTYTEITAFDTESFFDSITALAPDKIWIAGSYGHVKTASVYFWNGSAWNQEPVSLDSESVYQSISASATDNVWVTGIQGTQAAQKFDGTNWIEHSPPNDHLNAVKALASDDVYGVGDAIVHWDGSGWRLIQLPTVSLKAISAVSATDLWAVGGSKVLHGTQPCSIPLTATPVPPTAIPCAVSQAQLIHPQDNSLLAHPPASLTWQKQDCANTYKIAIRRGSPHGKKILATTVTSTRYNASWLQAGRKYYWHVRACNVSTCSKWSPWRSFKIQP